MKRWVDNPTVLLILAALTLTGFALQQANQLDPVEGLALRLLRSPQRVLNHVAHRIDNILTTIEVLDTLQATNEALQDQVDELIVENVRLREAEIENRTLREQLNFKREAPHFDIDAADVIGRVISRDPSNLARTITIDLGYEDDVAKGMPVVTARGLVGQITTVGPRSSRVLLIIDPSSSVNSVVQDSRATGVVEGRLSGDLVMRFIPQEEQISVGDIVLTSGLGGNFPKRLVIGQVTAVRQHDIELFQEATVRPSVDFNRLEVVMVIRQFTPMPPQE